MGLQVTPQSRYTCFLGHAGTVSRAQPESVCELVAISPFFLAVRTAVVLSFHMLSYGGLFPDREGDAPSAADDHGSLGLLARGHFRHRQENQLSGTWGGRGTFWVKVLLGHRRVQKTVSFLLDVVVTVCDSWTHCCHYTTMTRNVIHS